MPDRELKQHDKGAGVIEAQGLLNRAGAILDLDGGFGGGTEAAVREFQATSGIIDAATWQRLRGLPEPSPDIPTRAVAFIAREEPAQLIGTTIPWHAAWAVFIRRTLPAEIDTTRATFTGPVLLPPLCLGVLVSLVYNRGSAMADTTGYPGSRKEMRDIRDAVAAGRTADVPAALRTMKRFWPKGNGLRDRHEREAKLFEEGLA
jgi:peptidoglycan hydrolase-like protein with peptidoglycan-binding domain